MPGRAAVKLALRPRISDSQAPAGNILTGGGIGGPVLYQVPSLLFANVTIRKPRGTTPLLPVVGPPR